MYVSMYVSMYVCMYVYTPKYELAKRKTLQFIRITTYIHTVHIHIYIDMYIYAPTLLKNRFTPLIAVLVGDVSMVMVLQFWHICMKKTFTPMPTIW